MFSDSKKFQRVEPKALKKFLYQPIPTSNLLIHMYMSTRDFKVCFGKLVGFTHYC
jgi:hypothetical protein